MPVLYSSLYGLLGREGRSSNNGTVFRSFFFSPLRTDKRPDPSSCTLFCFTSWRSGTLPASAPLQPYRDCRRLEVQAADAAVDGPLSVDAYPSRRTGDDVVVATMAQRWDTSHAILLGASIVKIPLRTRSWCSSSPICCPSVRFAFSLTLT